MSFSNRPTSLPGRPALTFSNDSNSLAAMTDIKRPQGVEVEEDDQDQDEGERSGQLPQKIDTEPLTEKYSELIHTLNPNISEAHSDKLIHKYVLQLDDAVRTYRGDINQLLKDKYAQFEQQIVEAKQKHAPVVYEGKVVPYNKSKHALAKQGTYAEDQEALVTLLLEYLDLAYPNQSSELKDQVLEKFIEKWQTDIEAIERDPNFQDNRKAHVKNYFRLQTDQLQKSIQARSNFQLVPYQPPGHLVTQDQLGNVLQQGQNAINTLVVHQGQSQLAIQQLAQQTQQQKNTMLSLVPVLNTLDRSLKAKFDQNDKQLVSLSDNLDDLIKQTANYPVVTAEQKQRIDQLIKASNFLNDKIFGLAKLVQASHGQLDKKISDLGASTDKRLLDIHNDQKGLLVLVDKAKKDLAGAQKADLIQVTKKVDDLIPYIDATSQALDQKISDVYPTLRAVTDQTIAQKLSDQQRTVNGLLSELSGQLQSFLQEGLSTVQTKISDHDAALGEMKKSLAVELVERNHLSQFVTSLAEKKQLVGLEQKVSGLFAQIEGMELQNQLWKQAIASTDLKHLDLGRIDGEINAQTKGIHRLYELVEQSGREMGALTGRVTHVEGRVQASEREVKQVETDLVATKALLAQRQDQLERSLNDIRTEIKTQPELKGLQSDLQTVLNDANQLKDEFKKLKRVKTLPKQELKALLDEQQRQATELKQLATKAQLATPAAAFSLFPQLSSEEKARLLREPLEKQERSTYLLALDRVREKARQDSILQNERMGIRTPLQTELESLESEPLLIPPMPKPKRKPAKRKRAPSKAKAKAKPKKKKTTRAKSKTTKKGKKGGMLSQSVGSKQDEKEDERKEKERKKKKKPASNQARKKDNPYGHSKYYHQSQEEKRNARDGSKQSTEILEGYDSEDM